MSMAMRMVGGHSDYRVAATGDAALSRAIRRWACRSEPRSRRGARPQPGRFSRGAYPRRHVVSGGDVARAGLVRADWALGVDGHRLARTPAVRRDRRAPG